MWCNVDKKQVIVLHTCAEIKKYLTKLLKWSIDAAPNSEKLNNAH